MRRAWPGLLECPAEGDVPKWLRERSAKPLCGGSNPPVASKTSGLFPLPPGEGQGEGAEPDESPIDKRAAV